MVASSQTRGSHIFVINYFYECEIVGMQSNDFEHVYEKVKEAKARKTQKEMHKCYR